MPHFPSSHKRTVKWQNVWMAKRSQYLHLVLQIKKQFEQIHVKTSSVAEEMCMCIVYMLSESSRPPCLSYLTRVFSLINISNENENGPSVL